MKTLAGAAEPPERPVNTGPVWTGTTSDVRWTNTAGATTPPTAIGWINTAAATSTTIGWVRLDQR